MTIPTITNLEVPLLPTEQAAATIIRDSITAAGFSDTNYDTWNETNWVIKHIWDASKSKGFIYLHFQLNNSGSRFLILRAYLTWNIGTHSGTGYSESVTLDMGYAIDSPSFKLKITAISHPELKGFIWQQEDRFGSLYFARPAVIVDGYGFDDINFGWYFLLNSDWSNAYQVSANNPFNHNGSFQIESWSQLKYKIPATQVAQIVPSPRIIAPDNSGFVGWFSPDIGLCSSYNLEWKTPLRDGLRNYLLLRPKSSSGPTIATN